MSATTAVSLSTLIRSSVCSSSCLLPCSSNSIPIPSLTHSLLSSSSSAYDSFSKSTAVRTTPPTLTTTARCIGVLHSPTTIPTPTTGTSRTSPRTSSSSGRRRRRRRCSYFYYRRRRQRHPTFPLITTPSISPPPCPQIFFYPKGASSCNVEWTVSYEVPQLLIPVASALQPFLESLLVRGLERFAKFAKEYSRDSTG